jgi:FtsP/CotA-like multicopper oxidase with cupredoxin domain/peroxiredoxin
MAHKNRRHIVACIVFLSITGTIAILRLSSQSISAPPAVESPNEPPPQEPVQARTEGAARKVTSMLPGSVTRPADPPAEEAAFIPAYEPETWRDQAENVLHVQKRKIALPGAAQDGGPAEVEVLTYNGQLVGPTIRVRRGRTFKIKVINELPGKGEPPVTVDPGQEDSPHGLFITNLHTHGLHISPDGTSDNVFIEIAPGKAFQYSYTIPPDHPVGTFWYHPHKHGSVAYQMGNGMAGALIIEDDGKPAPVLPLEQVPEIKAAQEHILVLQQLILRKDVNGVGRVDPNDIYTQPPSPEAYQVTAVNGVVTPTYRMQPGEVQRWRFIHAGRDAPIPLAWCNDRGRRVRNFRFHEIAVDGLATGTINHPRFVTLFPGNRSDVLIKAPADPGIYYLTTDLDDDGPPADLGQRRPTTVLKLARLIVAGPPRDMSLPSEAQLAGCKPYRSIDPRECTVKRQLVFEYDDKKKFFHIDGVSFSKQPRPARILLGSTEEWTLTSPFETGGPDPHPFHMHVNPFQVVRVENLQTGELTKVDEWRDTIAVERGKRVTIRVRFHDFTGKTVYHCHTLDHEDQGMMRTFRIVTPGLSEEEGDEPVGKLTDCAIPAPALEGPTIKNLTGQKNPRPPGTMVLVFFRGLECVHCARELRDLLRQAGDLADTDTTFIAVSSEPIAESDKAIQALQIPTGLGFVLLVDENHRLFRNFGCYDQEPRHGLFILDRTGMIRAQYIGNEPFANAQEVYARVRRLLAEGHPGR